MFRRILQYSIAALVVAFAPISIPAQSSPLTATINLPTSTQVADKTLAPGEYHVVFEGDQAGNDHLCAFISPAKIGYHVTGENTEDFKREGVVTAEVPCTLKSQQRVADTDLAVTSQNRLVEVQFGGKAEAIEFAALS